MIGLLALAVLFCDVNPTSASAATPAEGADSLRGASSLCPLCTCPQDTTTTPAASREGRQDVPPTARHAQDQMYELLLPIRALATAPGLSNTTLAAHPAAGRQLLEMQKASTALLLAAGAGKGGTARLMAIAADPLFAAHLSTMFQQHSGSHSRPKDTGAGAQGSFETFDGGPELTSAAAANGSARVLVSAPAGHRSLATDRPPARTAPTVSRPTAIHDIQERVPVQSGEALQPAGRPQRRWLQGASGWAAACKGHADVLPVKAGGAHGQLNFTSIDQNGTTCTWHLQCAIPAQAVLLRCKLGDVLFFNAEDFVVLSTAGMGLSEMNGTVADCEAACYEQNCAGFSRSKGVALDEISKCWLKAMLPEASRDHHATGYETFVRSGFISVTNGSGQAITVQQRSGTAAPRQTLAARGGLMAVTFKGALGQGFVAEYWCGDAAKVGCTDPIATNYDPAAILDDGSCITACGPNKPLPLPAIATSHAKLNFTGGYQNNMDCAWRVECGGGQAALLEFTIFATEVVFDYVSLADGSGTDVGDGKLSGTGNWSGTAMYPSMRTHPHGMVSAGLYLAKDGKLAVAFHSDAATTANGFAAKYWCGEAAMVGCTDPIATNYYPAAIVDDNSCTYIDGCTDSIALNYNATATRDKVFCSMENCFTSCIYPDVHHDGAALRAAFVFGPGGGVAAGGWAGTSVPPSWMAGSDPCSAGVRRGLSWSGGRRWDGVTVCTNQMFGRQGGRVQRVDLSGRVNLGRFELVWPSLRNLTSLQSLDLRITGLSGTLPPEVGELADLQYLYFQGTGLSGTLPPGVGKLARLDTLSLYGTRLSGTLPPAIGGLTGLRSLYVSDTGLSGTLPPEVVKLAGLRDLQLSGTGLSGTLPPEAVGMLNGLHTLQLYSTELSGTLPAGLCLATLDFHNCRLDRCGTAGSARPALSTTVAASSLRSNSIALGPPQARQLPGSAGAGPVRQSADGPAGREKQRELLEARS